MDRLAQALESVRDGTSAYWAFYEPEAVAADGESVEVRLNGSPEAAHSFQPPQEWKVHRVQWGEVIYLRRHQRLTQDTVEVMLIEMLEFAGATGKQFQSWTHGAEVD